MDITIEVRVTVRRTETGGTASSNREVSLNEWTANREQVEARVSSSVLADIQRRKEGTWSVESVERY